MAPDTPSREPEMQDTPPCQCPKQGGQLRLSVFLFVPKPQGAVIHKERDKT